jgi:hypothetical protein
MLSLKYTQECFCKSARLKNAAIARLLLQNEKNAAFAKVLRVHIIPLYPLPNLWKADSQIWSIEP